MIMQETRSRLDELERKKKNGRSHAPTESVNEGTVRPSRNRRGDAGVTDGVENASAITVTLPMVTPAGRTGTVVEESVLHPGATEFTRAESERGQTVVAGVSEGSEHLGDEDYPEEYEAAMRLRKSVNGEVQWGRELKLFGFLRT